MKKLSGVALAAIVFNGLFAQSVAFNQNAARTNRFASLQQQWSIDLASGLQVPAASNEKSLFRGNSIASKFSARYQFGWLGLGLSAGLTPGSISNTAISQFLTDRKIPAEQASVSSTKPSNSYLLFGPTLQWGQKVQVLANLQGGLFVNDPGAVTINQTGISRAVYRFEGGSKNIFPGFSGALQLAYPINKNTRFFINTDYQLTQSSIRIADLQSGIDQATEQTRKLQFFTAGVGITRSFVSGEAASGRPTGKRAALRDAASGRATGRRQHQPVDQGSEQGTGNRILPAENRALASPRDAASGLATGRRKFQPGQPVYGNINRTEACGPVTQKITYPDGTTEENTFSCPEDALNYNQRAGINGGMPNRISMNVTVPKQTQGATFGEKVNQGLSQAGNALSQGASRNIISGKLSWGANAAYAIVTNKQRGGSVTMNSQTSSTRTTNQSSFGTLVRSGFTATIYARDAASGLATGKRAAPREAASGLATGRRQYQPVFSSGNGAVCNPCMAAINENPLYQSGNNAGTNPTYDPKNRPASGGGENDCDGIGGVTVYLVDASGGSVLATTVTERCGEFWFANVPDGEYVIRISGTVIVTKQYDITIDKSGNKDIAGLFQMGQGNWLLDLSSTSDTLITTVNDAAISHIQSKSSADLVWSPRSNRKILTVAAGDLDGDGMPETIVGGAVPGANALSSALRSGNPIKGIVVKGSSTSNGWVVHQSSTNEFGEFEWRDLEPGNHSVIAEQLIAIEEESFISTGEKPAQQKVQDHNSSRSNKSGSAIDLPDNNTDEANALKAQNNNTVRSNRGGFRSILIEADTDGDGDYETDISSSYAYSVAVNEHGEVSQPVLRAGVSTSRSNVRNRSAVQPLGQDLYLVYGTAWVNGKEVPVKSVLKTKHDTAKNAIGNIR